MGSAQPEALSLASLFLLGFLGSGHCVGMCGPLIIAFPARHGGWVAHLTYNLGRLLTYTGVGALVGGLGASAAHYGTQGSFVWSLRVQLACSLLSALFLGLFGLWKLGLIAEPRLLSKANPARFPGFRALQRRLLGEQRRGVGASLGLLALGLLLGFLPCGLSFAAFARALGAHGALEGACLTLAFGLGTLPGLLLVGASATRLSAQHRRMSDIIAGMLMVGMAVSLLLAAI